ncbi:MAG TPA: hypothetical protein VI894_01290 [Candidatus Nanoarchaeia archaeon]|nr:hypothetical protein [Candidatus Nanoarchaeia archaeon]
MKVQEITEIIEKLKKEGYDDLLENLMKNISGSALISIAAGSCIGYWKAKGFDIHYVIEASLKFGPAALTGTLGILYSSYLTGFIEKDALLGKKGVDPVKTIENIVDNYYKIKNKGEIIKTFAIGGMVLGGFETLVGYGIGYSAAQFF